MLDKIFANRPLLSTAIIFSIAIILAYYLMVSFFQLFIVVTLIPISILAAILLKEKRNIFIVFAIFLAGFSLMSWQEIKYKSEYSLANYNGFKGLEITGQVKEELSSLQGNKVLLQPFYVSGNYIKYGMIQLDKRYIPLELKNGDIIKIKLSLFEPYQQMNPGGFSNYKYLKRKGVYSQGYIEGDLEFLGHINTIMIDSIITLKYHLISLMDQRVEHPYNELFKALLLGERDRLVDEWEQSFTLAGVNHLLAISGLHVGFITLIFLYLLKLFKLPAEIRNLILSFLLILYIIITGFRPSVFRAGLLSIAFLWAPYFHRKGDLLNVLGMTAFMNLLINPYQLFSVGFQLSYFIILMILFWYKYLKKHISSVFAVSTAALFGSSPLTAYYFNLLTPVALISNIWAIPLVGLLVSIALIAVILGFIHPIFTTFIFKLLIFPTKFLIIGTRIMSAIPYGNFEVATPPTTMMIFIFAILLILPFLINKRVFSFNERLRKKRLYYLSIFSLIFILINIFIPVLDQQLEICFISVGQGDSILLSTPDNYNVLIDGGGYLGYDSTQGEYTIIPYLKHKGIRKLDLVFISHFDADHALGILDILGERMVNILVLPYNYERNALAEKIINKADYYNIPIVLAGEGDYFKLGEVKLSILNPIPDSKYKPISRNENSLLIKVDYCQFSVLLTGDIEKVGENRILNKGYKIKSDILKLGHHGSNSSSSEEFLKQVSPGHGIISVGKNNYGHPSEEVLIRAMENEIVIWRTDIQGAITVKSDGYKYSVEGYIED